METRINNQGYVEVIHSSHPLADTSHRVMLHRVLMWDKLNGQDTQCAWCPKEIYWNGKRYYDAITVDHLDWNPLNNDIDNLVPCCQPCNTRRRNKKVIPYTHKDRPPERKCSIEGCDKKHAQNGLCAMHSARMKRHGTLVPKYVRKQGKCSIDGCEAQAKSKGYCNKHYKSEYHTGNYCSVEGCEKKVSGNGLCNAHYMKEWEKEKHGKM